MKEFSIPLNSDYERPVIDLYRLHALIDTCSVIPVFSIHRVLFEEYFDTKKIHDNVHVSGLDCISKGSIYSIAEFKIGELIFENFEVFVPNEPAIRFPISLSASLFRGMDFEFDRINEKFIVRMKDDQNLKRDFKLKKIRSQIYPEVDGFLVKDIDINLHNYPIIF